MTPTHLTIIVSALALGGQLANYILNLRIRTGQLESEQRVMDHVACKYREVAVCDPKMEAISARVAVLEKRLA